MNGKDFIGDTSSENFLISDLVTIIHNSFKSYLMFKIADLNITSGQIPFILELLHSKNLSQEELSKKLFLTRGATAKTLRKLDDKGIVERRIATNNRRKYEVFLTLKGMEIALEIEKIVHSWEEIILSHLKDSNVSKNFEEEEKTIKLLKNLAKISIEVFSGEMRKIDNFDDSEDYGGNPPFAEFPFRGPMPVGNFFKRMGCFGKGPRRK